MDTIRVGDFAEILGSTLKGRVMSIDADGYAELTVPAAQYGVQVAHVSALRKLQKRATA